MKVQIIKPGVTDGGSVLDVGAVVDYADAVAASLIKDGYAVEAVEVRPKAPKADNDDKPTKKVKE